jgi:hypothetical protein
MVILLMMILAVVVVQRMKAMIRMEEMGRGQDLVHRVVIHLVTTLMGM